VRTTALIAAATALALAACKNVAPDATQPALIVEPTDASRAALQATVNKLLDTEVVLSGEALTDTSFLFIERRVPQSIDGSPAKGRNMEMPYRFTLLTNGTDCVLVDERDDSRHLLADTKCVVADGETEQE
jgi:hypothetical protein